MKVDEEGKKGKEGKGICDCRMGMGKEILLIVSCCRSPLVVCE